MRVSNLFIAFMALIPSHVVLAGPLLLSARAPRDGAPFTNTDFYGIVTGSPFTIGWTSATGDVTLTLLNGPATDIKPVFTIATGLQGTSYTWTPPFELVSDMYALQISDSTGSINYSSRFWISGAPIQRRRILPQTNPTNPAIQVHGKRDIVSLTNTDYTRISTGSPFTIGWTGATGDVTLTLLNGPATDVKPVFTIASGLQGNSFEWTPPGELVSDMYAFQISDSTGSINYSSRFWISGAPISRRTAIARSISRHRILPKTRPEDPNFQVHGRSVAKVGSAERPQRPGVHSISRREFEVEEDKTKTWKESLSANFYAIAEKIKPSNSKVDESSATTSESIPSSHVQEDDEILPASTFLQGSAWKSDNFRHGTWTSASGRGNADV